MTGTTVRLSLDLSFQETIWKRCRRSGGSRRAQRSRTSQVYPNGPAGRYQERERRIADQGQRASGGYREGRERNTECEYSFYTYNRNWKNPLLLIREELFQSVNHKWEQKFLDRGPVMLWTMVNFALVIPPSFPTTICPSSGTTTSGTTTISK